MSDFRIEFTIQRADDGDSDWIDIGFGSSGGWSTIEAALFEVRSAVQNQLWETEPGMPDPSEAEQETAHE